MNGPVSALLEAARRGLREAVQPEVRSDHARAQLAAVMEILAKLERMADWSPVIQREEQEALEATVAAVEQRARAAGFALPDAVPDADALLAARARVRQLSDEVFTSLPPGPPRDELDALLRAGLRAAVAAERRHVPRTDFSAMTGSKET